MTEKELLGHIYDKLLTGETLEDVRDISNTIVNDILELTQSVIKIYKLDNECEVS